MSGILPLSYKPTPLGPDFGQTLANAQTQMNLQQQAEAVKRQNALMGIFKDPNSLDGTGNPTPETLQKATAIDPEFGLKLRQNSMVNQDREIRMKYFMSEQAATNADRINEAYAPIVERREEKIKGGMPAAQADQEAQGEMQVAYDNLSKAGMSPEVLKNAPREWDPVKIPIMVQNTKGFRDWQTQQRQEQEQKRREKHDEDMNYNRGTQLLLDTDKKPVTYRPNAPPGEQFKYKDGSNVPDDKLPGVAKVGAGGGGSAASQENQRIANLARFEYEKKLGHPVDQNNPEEVEGVLKAQQDAIDKHRADSAGQVADAKSGAGGSVATKDRRDQEFIIRNKYEAELGHPVETDDEKAELKSRVLAAEDKRRATSAGDVARERQAATAAPKDVIIDGKPGQAIWKNGHYYKPDGVTQLPDDVEVRSNAKPATPAAAAERDAMTVADSRIQAAEQKRGSPLSPEEKAEIRRTARSDPKVQEAIRKSEGTAIDDDAARIIAEETIHGDFHGTVGMGRNQASMRKIANFRGEIAKELGLSGADLAANTAEFMGVIAAERTLGVRGAGIDTGIEEAKRFGPMVLAASDKVGRTRFKSVNDLLLAYEQGTGGEDVVRLVDAMNAYKMAYTQILTRGGMPTDDARRRSDEIIDKAWSNGQIKAAIDQLGKEMDGAQSSIPAVRDNLYHTLTGKTRNTVPEPKGAARIPTQDELSAAPKITNDAAGQAAYKALGPNQLFIAPDGKPHYTPADQKPATAAPAATPAQTAKPIPLPANPKAEDLQDNTVYETARGLARWDAKTKQFFPVRGQ